MAIELLKAVNSLITGDVTIMALATGGAHQAMAPALTVPPFVIFYQVPSAGPDYMFGGAEAYDEVLIVVKGVAQDRDDATAAGVDLAEQIRERAKVLLSNASLVVTGFNMLSVLCDRPLMLIEEIGGRIRYHRGDYYRALLQKL